MTVRTRFTERSLSRLAGNPIATIAIALLLSACGDGGRSEEPRHLILVVADTLRADRMSIYGHDAPTTPFLDSRADELVRFAEVKAPAPWTIPTHSSLFTGLRPSEHRAQWGSMRLDDRFETLAERLAGEGFRTAGYSANLLVAASSGLTQGFAEFELVRGPWPEKTGVILDKVPEVLDRATAADHRLFLFLNLMDTHIPYNDVLHGGRFGLEGRGPVTNASAKWRISAGNREFGARERREHRAAYDAGVRALDDALAGLVQLLEERGLLEESLLVVTSDHGEGLGDHPELGHSISVWEEQLAVPLLVRFPEARRGGEVVARRTSLAALMPSILDWMGLPRPRWMVARDGLETVAEVSVVADYRSYFSEDNRKTNRKIAERYPELAARVTHRHVVYCDALKLIVGPEGAASLFDLESDPTEQTDLADRDADELRACAGVYRAELAAGRLTPFDATTEDAGEGPDLETLRALGYVD